MKLLHIDSSILGPMSVSRTLSAEVAAKEVELHPGIEVIYRDVTQDNLKHLTGVHMAALLQGVPVEDEAIGADLAAGGAYLDEVLAADIIVIGVPMYNFSIPSQLKIWVDRIVVPGKSVGYNEQGVPIGLVTEGKRAIIASARGNVYSGASPHAALEHQDSYLKGVLNFIGIDDVTIVRAEGVHASPEAREAAMNQARTEILNLAA